MQDFIRAGRVLRYGMLTLLPREMVYAENVHRLFNWFIKRCKLVHHHV